MVKRFPYGYALLSRADNQAFPGRFDSLGLRSHTNHLLRALSSAALSDPNGHLLIQPVQETKQPAFRKQMILTVHQFRDLGLIDSKQGCYLALLELFLGENHPHRMTKLGAGK